MQERRKPQQGALPRRGCHPPSHSRLAALLQNRPVRTHAGPGQGFRPAAHTRGRGAGAVVANFRSAEAEGVAGETRRRHVRGRAATSLRRRPRGRPPPRAGTAAHARGRECRRRAPPRPRGRIGAAKPESSLRHQTKRGTGSTLPHRLPAPAPKLLGRNGAKPTQPPQVAMPPVSNTSAWMRADSTPSSCSVAICASRKPTGPHR